MDSGREERAVPVHPGLLEGGVGEVVHRVQRGRPTDRPADSRVGSGGDFSRRQASGLLAAVSRLSNVEALSGRLGPGLVSLRPRQQPSGADHGSHPHGSRSHVGRGRCVLRFGPGWRPESVSVRHRHQENGAGHEGEDLGRALAGFGLQRARRVRTERRTERVRCGDREVSERFDPSSQRRRRTASSARLG